MITTYISNPEYYTSVKDKELDELFQEIRRNNSKYYLQEVVMFEKKFFFSKTKKKILYTLYVDLKTGEFQIINFPQEHEWSINTAVAKSYIMTYFYGVMAGINKWW